MPLPVVDDHLWEPYRSATDHLAAYLDRLTTTLAERQPRSMLSAKDRAIAARERISTPRLPLLLLRRAGVDAPATLLFLLAAFAESTLANRLATRLAGTAPTVRALMSLLATADDDTASMMAALAADAPLRRLGLVNLRGDPRTTSLLHHGLYVEDRVVEFLHGEIRLDPSLADIAVLHTKPVATIAEVQTIWRLLVTPGPIIVEGASRGGKTTAAIAAITRQGRRALVADLEQVPDGPTRASTLRQLERETLLLDAHLVVRVGEAALDRGLLKLVARTGAILTVRDGTTAAQQLATDRRVAIAPTTTLAQQHVWRASLAPDKVSPSTVCRRYPLPVGDIVLAAAAARTRANAENRELAERDLMIAARGRLQRRLDGVANLLATTSASSDLVVSDAVDARLRELVAATTSQTRMDAWGFSKPPHERSISAVFSGPPGTGKTMAAAWLGKEVDRDVFRVDLAKVAGDTEAKLTLLFDEAARAGSILLFEDAHVLFGKRADAGTRHTSLLLQRLETHDGIVILATSAALDPAVLRRVRFRIAFPEPDDEVRTRLWRAMTPPTAPLADDVDFATLGRMFRLDGRQIKNAVVRAAFLAATAAPPAITQDMLIRAGTLELAS